MRSRRFSCSSVCATDSARRRARSRGCSASSSSRSPPSRFFFCSGVESFPRARRGPRKNPNGGRPTKSRTRQSSRACSATPAFHHRGVVIRSSSSVTAKKRLRVSSKSSAARGRRSISRCSFSVTTKQVARSSMRSRSAPRTACACASSSTPSDVRARDFMRAKNSSAMASPQKFASSCRSVTRRFAGARIYEAIASSR